MKKFLLILLLSALCVGAVSCRHSAVWHACVRHQDSSGFGARYSYFRGDITYTVRVGDEPMDLRVQVTTEEGALSMRIEQDGKVAYRGRDIPTSEFTVTLPDPGKYTVTVEGREHCGAFECTYVK